MGVFKKLFSKKKDDVAVELEIPETTEVGCLGEAEHIANIVATGLEKEKLFEMNKCLEKIKKQEEEKEIYIFEHPKVVGKFFATTICVLFSLICIYYLLIGIGTVVFSKEHFLIGLSIAGLALVILIINVLLIRRFISTIRYKVRFDLYEELLGYRSMEFVEDIAICSNQQNELVIKDLNRSVKEKLIPQGHFSRDCLVFMVSNSVYDKYMEKPAVYDRYFHKKMEERKREKSRTKEISQIMEEGAKYIDKIQDFGTLIKDKTISRKLDRMKNVVSMIFHEIDVNPCQASSMGIFLNYYLPTTEKLLDAYVSLGEKQVSGKNASKRKKEIEETLNKITIAFEGILEKLYEEQDMDIISDIAAMELAMRQEGLPVDYC